MPPMPAGKPSRQFLLHRLWDASVADMPPMPAGKPSRQFLLHRLWNASLEAQIYGDRSNSVCLAGTSAAQDAMAMKD